MASCENIYGKTPKIIIIYYRFTEEVLDDSKPQIFAKFVFPFKFYLPIPGRVKNSCSFLGYTIKLIYYG